MTKKRPAMSWEEMQEILRDAENAPVEDVTKEIEEVSRQATRHPEQEEAFIEHKLWLLESDPSIPDAEKAQLRLAIGSKLREQAVPLEQSSSLPPPGGVGYGMFYNSDFRKSFHTGTAIRMLIICPTRVGGNSKNYLYLTSTNRTSKGVEAFVSYYKQNKLSFRVYDWARAKPDRWQTDIPYDKLGDYLFDIDYQGTRQCLPVSNMTYQINASQWKNAAFLLNKRQKRWHLIYSYIYTSSTVEQQTGWHGSWGPIVETFQPQYRDTNQLGFLSTELASRSSGVGQWHPSHWQLLTASQSRVRNDHHGFQVVLRDPNYTFIVEGRP